MVSTHALREKTNRVPLFKNLTQVPLLLEYIDVVSLGLTCFSVSIASELSTSSSGVSFLRLMGTVPAASISQLENVRFPNCVAFAVNRRKFRFYELYWLNTRGMSTKITYATWH